MIIENISNIQSSIHIYRQSVKSQERIRVRHQPCENHERLSVIRAGCELCGVGLQHRQAQLEDGFDAVEEEAVDHADGAVEGQHAEEQCEKPGEGDGGEGREVRNAFGQFQQTLPD